MLRQIAALGLVGIGGLGLGKVICQTLMLRQIAALGLIGIGGLGLGKVIGQALMFREVFPTLHP